MSPSQGEYGATNALTGESGFAGSVGEGLLSNSSAFVNALLSGNQAQIGQLLAPQISGIAKQANEKTLANAQFGNRSGGTNASNQTTMDTARSSVNDMVSSLTSGALNAGLTTGSNLLNSSMSGYNDVFSQNLTEQQQRLAKFNDIISSIAQTVGAVAGMPGVSPGAAQGLNAAAGALE